MLSISNWILTHFMWSEIERLPHTASLCAAGEKPSSWIKEGFKHLPPRPNITLWMDAMHSVTVTSCHHPPTSYHTHLPTTDGPSHTAVTAAAAELGSSALLKNTAASVWLEDDELSAQWLLPVTQQSNTRTSCEPFWQTMMTVHWS